METENKCSEQLLENFSKIHLTYINQIFGDLSVREIIAEKYYILQQQVNEEFNINITNTQPIYDFSKTTLMGRDGLTEHHLLTTNGSIKCSIEDNIQNIDVDINDTLCQSYSLLNYFHIPIATDKKERQMQMIKLYKVLLHNSEFIEELNQIIMNLVSMSKKPLTKASRATQRKQDKWIDYIQTRQMNLFKTSQFVRKNINEIQEIIKQNIIDALQHWENYGYLYFIGNGNCNSYETYLFINRPRQTRSQARVVGGKKRKRKTKRKRRT
jgi:hypothetical protein